MVRITSSYFELNLLEGILNLLIKKKLITVKEANKLINEARGSLDKKCWKK